MLPELLTGSLATLHILFPAVMPLMVELVEEVLGKEKGVWHLVIAASRDSNPVEIWRSLGPAKEPHQGPMDVPRCVATPSSIG